MPILREKLSDRCIRAVATEVGMAAAMILFILGDDNELLEILQKLPRIKNFSKLSFACKPLDIIVTESHRLRSGVYD